MATIVSEEPCAARHAFSTTSRTEHNPALVLRWTDRDADAARPAAD